MQNGWNAQYKNKTTYLELYTRDIYIVAAKNHNHTAELLNQKSDF